jgi:hypothetical protein
MGKPAPSKQKAGLLVFLPRATPALPLMLADIGEPSVQSLAATFGVDRKTAQRWVREGTAPRSVLLALYYVTRWGRSEVHCRAENDARAQAALAFALRTELDKANALLAQLGQIGDFGSANDPARQVASRPPAPPAPGEGDAQPTPATADQVQQPKTASQRRAAQAAKRLAKRASGPTRPFDFLRFG